MRKKIITITTLLSLLLLFILLASCNQSSNKKAEASYSFFEEVIDEQPGLTGEQWLKNIFQCDSYSGYCFPDEEKVTTDRYYEFFIETLAIFEYPQFTTEDEKVAAVKAYNIKWKDIYPLDEELAYPFGRGNGLGYRDQLEDVTITPQSDTEHTVFIHYGGEYKTETKVSLIPDGNSYLIDYMNSEYIE